MGNAHGQHGGGFDSGAEKKKPNEEPPSPPHPGMVFIGKKNDVKPNFDVEKGLPDLPAVRAYRPRATTESGPRRHVSVDVPHFKLPDAPQQTNALIKDPESRKMPTIFKYNGTGKDVYVCGTFNNWQKMRMSRSQKDFVAIVNLGEGSHEYRFNVDGVWVTDSNAPVSPAIDSNGLKNNRILVQKADFDAFEALDMDSATVEKAQSKNSCSQEAFGQQFPDFRMGGPAPGPHHAHKSAPGPPILPPHLLNVILNKDTPMSCEPTLLPAPNRVMLHHLYALSIKDGIMVLSSTQRYKQKYVTTLLYKPMTSTKMEHHQQEMA